MADVNEEIVRLYLENNDFLVRTNLKYYFRGNGNVGGDSDIDLVSTNLKYNSAYLVENFILTAQDLKGIKNVAIEVKGWHTENFSPSVINTNPRIFYMLRKEAQTEISSFFHGQKHKNILVISRLGQKEKDSIILLKNKGYDHIILFEEILDFLIQNIVKNKSYNSETMQIIRLLSSYNKLKIN